MTIYILIFAVLFILFNLYPVVLLMWSKHKERVHAEAAIGYSVYLKNNTDDVQRAVLFNSRKNRVQRNFGNPPGIEISFLKEGISYAGLLADTEYITMAIGLLRVFSKSSGQVHNDVNWQRITSDGSMSSLSIFPFSANKQNLSYITETVVDFRIDGNSELFYDVLPKTEVILTLFPYLIVNPGNILDGKPMVTRFKAPKHLQPSSILTCAEMKEANKRLWKDKLKEFLELFKESVNEIYIKKLLNTKPLNKFAHNRFDGKQKSKLEDDKYKPDIDSDLRKVFLESSKLDQEKY